LHKMWYTKNMKKYFRHRIAFFGYGVSVWVLVLGILLSGTIAIYASDGATVADSGGTQNITGPDGVCKKVTNSSGHGSVYIPTVSSAEWQSFYNHPPSGVTVANCGCTGSYTWIQRDATHPWSSVAFYANDTKVAALSGSSVYTSTNNGINFTQRTTPGWISYLYGSRHSNTLLVQGGNGTQQNTYVSTNDAASWTTNLSISPLGNWAPGWSGAAVSDTGNHMISAWERGISPWGGAYTSDNGGTSWTDRGSGVLGEHIITASIDATKVLRYVDSGIPAQSGNGTFYVQLSTDGGISWATIATVAPSVADVAGSWVTGWGRASISGDGSKLF
jgi:hypothetical protein